MSKFRFSMLLGAALTIVSVAPLGAATIHNPNHGSTHVVATPPPDDNDLVPKMPATPPPDDND